MSTQTVDKSKNKDSANAAALVSTQWVADNVNNPNIHIVEVSVETSLYATEHLPGAVNFSWTTQLQDQVRRDIISKEDFEALLSRSGISPTTHVILYGDNNNWFAAYAFWIFHYYGHDNVSLMDGGLKKWKLENRPLISAVPTYPAIPYKVTRINAELRADRDYVKARLGEKGGFAMVDVRSTPEYNGEIIAPPGMTETAQRAGHIPGAVNIPWGQAVAEDGSYKSKEELAKLYGDKGIGANGEIVTYCRIGERSSHTWVVLKYILGYDNVRNYDGSWTEWGNLIGNPIRKGAQP